MIIAHNDDVLTQILLWLPAKSLIRFKLVCKRWFCLISSPQFSRSHTLHRHLCEPEPSCLLHLLDTRQYYHLHCSLSGAKLVRYHFPVDLVDPTVCGFSNGLFLLKCNSPETDPQDCHVYNPATRQSKKILLSVHDRYTMVMGLNLAFDTSKPPHFKIVCVRAAGRRRISGSIFRGWWRYYLIEVYDSETCTWKICGEQFSAPRSVDFNCGIYWNGGIQWGGFFYNFDTNTLEEHPSLLDVGEEIYVESNGSLHYIAHFPHKKMIEVFELQRDYSPLLSKYQIRLDMDSGPLSVLSIIKGEFEEDSRLLVHRPGKIMTYEFPNKSFKEVLDFKEEEFYKESCIQFVSRSSFQFFETLTPVE